MKRMLYLRERTCFSAQSPPAFQHCEKPTGRCRAGGQADKKKKNNSKVDWFATQLRCLESAWAGGGVRRLKWNLRTAITWLRPAPVFSRRLLDISLTSSRHPGKKKPSPAGESQQSLLKRGAAEKPTSDDTWNKFRAEKKGEAYRATGGTFLSGGPTPSAAHSAERRASP